jgi:hypothetical protein
MTEQNKKEFIEAGKRYAKYSFYNDWQCNNSMVY